MTQIRTRLSTKGQIIIPKSVREARGWKAGTEFILDGLPDGSVMLRPVAPVPETTLDQVIGCTGYDGPRVSIEQMEQAIARGARGE